MRRAKSLCNATAAIVATGAIIWKPALKELSVMKSKLLNKRVKSPEILPVLKYFRYLKSMLPSNYSRFFLSPAAVLQ